VKPCKVFNAWQSYETAVMQKSRRTKKACKFTANNSKPKALVTMQGKATAKRRRPIQLKFRSSFHP
jgi:hypothetical protein